MTKPKKSAAKKSAKTPAKRNDNVKILPNKISVTAFINTVENDTRRNDAKTLLALMKKVTGDKPVMWGPSIIGFGSYHYKYATGREGDMCLVGFSPRKANMSIYVMGVLGAGEPLLAKLGKHKAGAGCLYVNKLEDVDLDVLTKIIEKSYRVTKEKYSVG